MDQTTPVARHSVAVIGGGQAGLSISWDLARSGIDHVVFEKQRAGHAWRAERWDTFCLVTPNWQCQFPGFPYQGSDPHGFMLRDEIIAYMDAFVSSFNPPLREGVTVKNLRANGQRGFMLDTTEGLYGADQVVIAAGGYQIPIIPRCAERLSSDIVQVHSSSYRNPDQLPPGAVLVVGSGQSGCQIAEDLHLAGRTVHLAVGSAPRSARRYRGRDTVAWLDEMGYYAKGVDEFTDADEVRLRANGLCNMLGRGATVVSPFIVLALFKSNGVAGVLGLMIGLLVVQIIVVAIWGIETSRRGLEELEASPRPA